MLWDTPAFDASLHSLYVSLGTATLCLALSVVLAFATVIVGIPGGRLLRPAILSLVLVPLYVQATAWSAGFGDQSVLRWNQVTAALHPGYAILACIWIQAASWLPLGFLLVSIAFERSLNDSFRLALLERGLVSAFWRVALRDSFPWIALAWLLIAVLTTNDMVVTNLFRVPTWTETLYQQVQFQKTRSAPMVGMFLYAAAIAIMTGVTLLSLATRIGGEFDNHSLVSHLSPRSMKWGAGILAWCIAFCFVGLPVLALVIKAGWQVIQIDGTIQRTWSLRSVLDSLIATREFIPELQWSLAISFYTTLLAIGISLIAIAIAFAGSRTSILYRSAWIAAAFAFCFALPGPLVNWSIQQCLVDQTGWLGWMGNDTLAAPVLALQTRCAPVLFGSIWVAAWRWEQRFGDLRALDGTARKAHWRALARPFCVGVLAAFFVGFANLESYLLVLPPSVTPVSMRMFELLHYGVQNQDAGLALGLVAISVLTTYGLSWRRWG
ncbi:hypothetical protein VN12_16785 [Pirellula sp. SH-Sr6A]|uniref:hypothetical protein n=1 Tax=Pirellula sp. SH-Sr6A TaxID=1632865 RepID=UPI00078C2F8F|nr:hypothetical protein [Pirellula sp. SH-Sr6A]AMV33786.1 hypothetical protein VN12_16785 [Pirellula sp. SH-Sr6A]